MPDTLRLAFLGCGAIAGYHLDGIQEHAPRIDVTAAIDVDVDKARAYAAETRGGPSAPWRRPWTRVRAELGPCPGAALPPGLRSAQGCAAAAADGRRPRPTA